MTPQQATFHAPTLRGSVRPRLLHQGIGTVVALAYWGVVAAMLVAGAVFLLAFGSLFIPLLWAVLCLCAYGVGLLLCAAAGLLTMAEATRRTAVAFLVASAAANVGIVVLGALLAAAIKLAVSIS